MSTFDFSGFDFGCLSLYNPAMIELETPDRIPIDCDARIAGLEDPLMNILAGLTPNLKQGEYSVLVGDDTSGRIPTLILRKVINAVYQDRGFPPIPTLFFPREYFAPHNAALRKRVEKIQETATGSRGLIVTEAIDSGFGVGKIAWEVYHAGVHTDVATIAIEGYGYKKAGWLLRMIPPGSTVYLGSKGDTPSIHGATSLTGIERRARYPMALAGCRETINAARNDVNTIANTILEKRQLWDTTEAKVLEES